MPRLLGEGKSWVLKMRTCSDESERRIAGTKAKEGNLSKSKELWNNITLGGGGGECSLEADVDGSWPICKLGEENETLKR